MWPCPIPWASAATTPRLLLNVLKNRIDDLMVLLPKRDIFAVRFGLRQIFSKDSLHLEKICRKASRTIGEKSPIVSSAIPLSHPTLII